MIQVNNREVVKPVNWTTNTIVQRSRLYQTPVKSKIQMKAGNTKQRPKTQPTIKKEPIKETVTHIPQTAPN